MKHSRRRVSWLRVLAAAILKGASRASLLHPVGNEWMSFPEFQQWQDRPMTSTNRAWVVCVLLNFFLVGSLPAQQAKKKGPKKENTKGTGVVQDLGPGWVLVTDKDEKKLYVKAPQTVEDFSFVAKADASWLRPGMIVSFTSRFKAIKKNGQVVKAIKPLRELMVVTPTKEKPIGAKPEKRLGGRDLFAPPTKTTKKKKAQLGPVYEVVGRLVKFRGGKMTLACGRYEVQADLVEGAKVAVKIADVRWVRQGDRVSFQGWYYPKQPDRIVARTMTIQAVEPLAGNRKTVSQKKRKATRKKNGKACGENSS